MSDFRKSACTVVVIAGLSAIAVPAFAGYAGFEGGPTPAAAQANLVGGVIAHLKREDDEEEVRKLAEQQPSLSERQAASEDREEAVREEADAQEPAAQQEEEG